MAIMVNNQGFDNTPWIEALAELLPGSDIRNYPDVGNRHDIEYAVIWDHPHGDLITYPNLKAILLLSAGVDFLKGDELPDVPVVRLIDESVAEDMAMHTLHWIIHFHRDYYRYQKNQSKQIWERYDYSPASELSIGILGLGEMGTRIARQLTLVGFQVSSWVRSERQHPGINLFIGQDRQQAFFSHTDILVNLLPLTPQTRSFINTQRFTMLPRGAFIINIGRGAVIDDIALKQALESGQVKAAALDVFSEEPLPDDSWLWSHPNVFVTPHVSGNTYARSGATKVAANILRIQNGDSPFPIYDPQRGY